MTERIAASDLASLRERLRGAAWREFIQHHLERQPQAARVLALEGLAAELPLPLSALQQEILDPWIAEAKDAEIWQSDASTVLQRILEDAEEWAAEADITLDDDARFSYFNMVALRHAALVHEDQAVRRAAGIGLPIGWPWGSALALVYPIAAMGFLANQPGTSGTEIIGFGIAQLGYLLVAAGLFVGSFRVLGLRSRRAVIVAGILALAIGTIASNIG